MIITERLVSETIAVAVEVAVVAVITASKHTKKYYY
jgi:hypothetical protein